MRRALTFPIILALLFGGGFLLYQAIITRQISLNDWFVGDMVRGVDVSSYQINTDFSVLESNNIAFAYIKATEGSSHKDPSFAEKWQAVAETDILSGAYHYFSYESSGAAQAENFISTVGDLSGRLIPAIDLELTTEEVKNPPEKDVVVRSLKSFIAILEEEYGVKPLLYSRQDYYEKYLADDFSDYPRWITNFFYPVFLEAGDDWAIWQYTDLGIIKNSHSGEKHIDLNVLNRKITLEDLKVK